MAVIAPNTIVPNAEYLDGATPSITLAGQEWPIPPLTPRQQKHVLPALFRLLPTLMSIRAQGETEAMLISMDKLTPEVYGTMIEVVFWGLSKAHPTLTQDQFEDMPITPTELIEALKVIADQSGVLGTHALPNGVLK